MLTRRFLRSLSAGATGMPDASVSDSASQPRTLEHARHPLLTCAASCAAVTTPAAEGTPDGDLALCLDVVGGAVGGSAAVTFAECTGDVDQRFGSLVGDTIDKVEPNAFAITGRRGTDYEGMCLTAQDDGSLALMECSDVIPESSMGDAEVDLGALWLFPALILPLEPASA